MTQNRIMDNLNMSQAMDCLCVRFNIECQALMSAGHLMLERPFNVESSV